MRSKQFEEIEYKYVDTHVRTPDEPGLTVDSFPPITHRVYEKERLQRSFECITENTDRFTLSTLETNSKYRELVFQCKSSQPQYFCDPSYPYRTIDGSCNNLLNPKYGSVLNCLKRLVHANYKGAAGLRQSVCGYNLPSPRFLSLEVHQGQNTAENNSTHITAFFGQLMAHDMTETAVSNINGKIIDCCSNPNNEDRHPQCSPLLLMENDPFYSKHNVKCINFVRSAPCDTCSVGERIQINQETTFLDLSAIYGSSEFAHNRLRARDGTGKLLIQENYMSGDLLPPITDNSVMCGNPEKGEYCFKSGDHRVNQHTSLTVLSTIFHREHNRIATKLKLLNPFWNEERLFQEAKKINTGQYQSIIYREFLPAILGPNLMTKYDLWIKAQGTTIYDAYVDPTLYIEFNTAAYRLHSTVNQNVTNFGFDNGKYLFRETSQDPTPLYHDNLSILSEGECLSPANKYGRYISTDLANYLLKTPSGKFGFDIAAFDILRGRDNGLPTYIQMLNFLSNGAINIQNFDDLQGFMDQENINILKNVYCHVADIDLWVGMNTERILPDGLIGPTSAEIIARQMKNLKSGDRFYFEHYGHFNEQQLQSLRGVSLSGVLCSSTRIQSMQINAFRFPSQSNPILLCPYFSGINIDFWKEF